MEWDEHARKAVELLPIPPMMGSYARIQSEKIARQWGLQRVTAEVVQETEKVYREFVGEEKTKQIRDFINGSGPAPAIEEELFFENDQASILLKHAIPNMVKTALMSAKP